MEYFLDELLSKMLYIFIKIYKDLWSLIVMDFNNTSNNFNKILKDFGHVVYILTAL